MAPACWVTVKVSVPVPAVVVGMQIEGDEMDVLGFMVPVAAPLRVTTGTPVAWMSLSSAKACNELVDVAGSTLASPK